MPDDTKMLKDNRNHDRERNMTTRPNTLWPWTRTHDNHTVANCIQAEMMMISRWPTRLQPRGPPRLQPNDEYKRTTDADYNHTASMFQPHDELLKPKRPHGQLDHAHTMTHRCSHISVLFLCLEATLSRHTATTSFVIESNADEWATMCRFVQ